MFGFLNQYSFVVIAVVVLGAEAYLLRRRFVLRAVAISVTIIAAAAFAFLMRMSAPDIVAAADLDRALARGRPVALEFFSNY